MYIYKELLPPDRLYAIFARGYSKKARTICAYECISGMESQVGQVCITRCKKNSLYIMCTFISYICLSGVYTHVR